MTYYYNSVPSIPYSEEDVLSFYDDIFDTVRLRIQTKILNVRLGKQLSKRYGNAKKFEFKKSGLVEWGTSRKYKITNFRRQQQGYGHEKTLTE